MSPAVPNPPPGFDDLRPDEQIETVQTLWNRIAASPEQVPVPDWHKRILRERLESYALDPDAGKTWDEVRREVSNDV